jgi:hypothetical protein
VLVVVALTSLKMASAPAQDEEPRTRATVVLPHLTRYMKRGKGKSHSYSPGWSPEDDVLGREPRPATATGICVGLEERGIWTGEMDLAYDFFYGLWTEPFRQGSGLLRLELHYNLVMGLC